MSNGSRRPVLILGLNHAPEDIGIGPYTAGLAEHIAGRGHRTMVVAARPYYPRWKGFEGYPAWWSNSNEQGIEITRCPHYIPANPGGARRLLHHASFALSSLLPMLHRSLARPALVLCIVPSLLSVPVAWLCARLSGAKLWIHVQDFEVEAALATGLLPDGSLLARIAPAAERFLLRRADLVTTISPQMCARLIEKGLPEHRVAELRNWANHFQSIAAADGAPIRIEWGLEAKFVALYSGNVANKQGLETVIDAARMLAHDERIAFVICGEGPNRARLEERARGLGNVRFYGLQPIERFAGLMRMTDCHLLPQIAEAADLVLPSKLTNMLASGKPVVATAHAGTGLAQEVAGCGLVVPPANAAAMADAILELAGDAELTSALGRAASRRAEARWSKARVLAQADLLLDMLVAERTGA